MIKLIIAAAIATLTAGGAAAATYSFDTAVQDVTVSGSFEIDDASANYVGGGTTNKADLTALSLTFMRGAETFTGSFANLAFLGTFNITYSVDLTTVTAFDFQVRFQDPSGHLAYAGNNTNGDGFMQVVDYFDDSLYAFQSPPSPLTATLTSPAAVPLPASAWMLLAALGGIGALARRKQRMAA